MKILAVDTSSSVASVAVAEDTRIIGEYTINHKKTHSQKLMPMIKELMDNLELAPGDVDVYAASTGPGSFTGLRIGVAAIKAMAFAAGKPVASVPTLDALAYNIPVGERMVCPIMDARNNQVFTALYRYEKDTQFKLTEYMGIHITELVDLVKGKNEKVIFLGDGVERHRDFINLELGDLCGFAPDHLLLQRAASVIQAAFIMASKGRLESSFEMAPFYLRKSQAERELELKQKRETNYL